MSGVFGYDGYAYQSNICLNLVLKKIVNGKNVQKFSMEVRKVTEEDRRENDFTVDLIIEYLSGEGRYSDIVEVKGGSDPDYEQAKTNLDKCSEHILAGGAEIVISKQIIVRVAVGEVTLLPPDIAIVPVEDKFESPEGYSELDNENVSLIEKLIENEIVYTKRDYIAKNLLHTLKHYLDFKLRELAWKLRQEYRDIQSCYISIQDLFEFKGSLADSIQLENSTRYNKHEALQILLGKNKYGVNYRGGEVHYKGPSSPATDSGAI